MTSDSTWATAASTRIGRPSSTAAASRNEPRFLPHVCAAVARWSGRTPTDVATASTAVAKAFFGI